MTLGTDKAARALQRKDPNPELLDSEVAARAKCTPVPFKSSVSHIISRRRGLIFFFSIRGLWPFMKCWVSRQRIKFPPSDKRVSEHFKTIYLLFQPTLCVSIDSKAGHPAHMLKL